MVLLLQLVLLHLLQVQLHLLLLLHLSHQLILSFLERLDTLKSNPDRGGHMNSELVHEQRGLLYIRRLLVKQNLVLP